MAKQLNIDMTIKADTSQAKKAFADLQKSLNDLTVGKTSNQNFSKQLQEGVKAASQLKSILASSTTSLGTLDLSKFTMSLQKSGVSLKEYQQKLSLLGTSGQQAFSKLAMSISTAELPLRRTSNLMTQLGTTLKNTAKWQLSSSLLHGFMGAISSAYGYAKDLNESLNNIRIRTGQSTEEMARFAEQANKAAQVLSTTTNAYTKAALIYYQQGLDDEQVKARTDITVKMANVTKDSAETVSQQLTAVWNNFDKTGEKLEYIADVMNALGAATASSTSEIATGLQKFAAVAETAGLSYEYAASALATITAVTRQSADTVGTGLRTVLARIESLNLGESLDDGVTLTKYTKALEKIGVDVLDVNGHLKDANSILDNMAAAWANLTEEQKMATAETVGGIRQYSTIMALMENWDFMQKNIGVAKGSAGTLQKQADIYAESWEAARKRVTAAAEDIYHALIDEDFFIGMDNAITGLLKTIKSLIDGFGGVQGVIAALGTVALTVFDSQISGSIDRMFENMKLRSNSFKESMVQTRRESIEAMAAPVDSTSTSGQISNAVMKNYAQDQSQIFEKLLSMRRSLTEEEQKELQTLQDIFSQTKDNAIESGQKLEKEEQKIGHIIEQEKERIRLQKESLEQNGKRWDDNNNYLFSTKFSSDFLSLGDALSISDSGNIDQVIDDIREKVQIVRNDWQAMNQELAKNGEGRLDFEQFLSQNFGEEAGSVIARITALVESGNVNKNKLYEALIKYEQVGIRDSEAQLKSLVEEEEALKRINQVASQSANISSLGNIFEQLGEKSEEGKQNIEQFNKQLQDLINIATKGGKISLDEAFGADGAKAISEFLNTGDIDAFIAKMKELKDTSKDVENDLFASFGNMGEEKLQKLREAYDALKDSIGEVNAKMLLSGLAGETALGTIDKMNQKIPSLGQGITSVARMVSSLGMAFNSIKGLANVWNDEDASVLNKIITTLTTLSSITMSLTFAFTKENIEKVKSIGTNIKLALSEWALKNSKDAEAKTTVKGAAASGVKTAANKAETLTTSQLTAKIWEYVAAQAVAHWQLLAFAAAIAAIVAIIAIYTKEHERLTNAEKEAGETAQSMTEAYNNAKNAFEELKQTIEDYKGAKDALEDLYQGTEEWTDTIQTANEKANELLNTYKELRQYAHFNASTGMMEFITESGNEYDLEGFLKEQEETLNQTYRSKVLADIAHLKSQNDLSIERFVRTGDNYDYNKRNYQTAGSLEQNNEKEIEQALSNLISNYSKNGRNLQEAKNSLNNLDSGIIEALGYTDQALYELCNSLSNNSKLLDANSQQIAHSLIEKSNVSEEDKNNKILNAIVGKVLEQKTEEELSKIHTVTSDMKDEFANVHNYTRKEGKYYDSNGNEVENITDSYIKEWTAGQRAESKVDIEALLQEAQRYEDALDGVISKTQLTTSEQKQAKEAIIDYLTGTRSNFDDLTPSITKALKDGNIQQELINLFTIDPQILVDLGKGDAEIFTGAMTASINEADPYARLTNAVGGYEFKPTREGDYYVSNNGNFLKDQLQSWYDNLTDEEKTLVAEIDFDSELAKNNIDDALGQVKAWAASEKISIELDLEEEDQWVAEELAEAFEGINRELANQEEIVQDNKIYQMLEDSQAAAEDAAIRYAKLNEAVEDLYDNFDKYEDVLTQVQKAQSKEEKTLAMATKEATNLRKTLAKLLDTSEEFIDSNFLDAIDADTLEGAARGVESDIDKIRDAFVRAQAEIAGITDGVDEFIEKLNTLPEGAVIDLQNDAFIQKLIESWVLAGDAEADIQSKLSGFHIDCDNVEFIYGMQDAADAATQMADAVVDSANRAIEGGSINAESQTINIDNVDRQEDTAFDELITDEGQTITARVMENSLSGPVEYETYIPEYHKFVQPHKSSSEDKKQTTITGVKLSNAHKSAGGNVSTNSKSVSSPRGGGGGKGGGGGGGGSAPKPAKTQKSKPKKVERYKEITDTIDDLAKRIEKTNTVSDRLWGKDRLSSMQKANDILKKQADAYKEKARQAENFLEIDKQALQNTLNSSWKFDLEGGGQGSESMKQLFKDYGMNLEEFQFDEDGDIINYTDVMTKLYSIYNYRQQKWANAANWANADEQSQYEAYWVKPLEEQINLIEEARKQYEETKQVREDNLEAAEEAIREWQDNNFEQLEYKLELKIEVDERELKKLEYYIEKMQDDFYLRAENLVNYIGKVEVAENELKNYANTVEELNKKYNEIDEQYKQGEISQDAYYKKLKEIQDEEYEQLQTLRELDKEISHYYGETLEAGREELEKHTDRLEHINGVLEHYQEIMSLLGKQTNYKMMGSILETVASNTMNSYLASKAWYDELSSQRTTLEQQLAGLEVGSDAYNTVKQELDDLVEQHEDAENDMYEKAEATAEAFEAVWRNTVESVQHDFEMLATNGLGFDFLNDSLDRLSSRQDEYLTKTNQIYEMNDLLRKLQTDMDKTSNTAAKQRIANFSREMEQLKNKNELSKLDLDIAKARYQQVLAEIALEEAQNAKSMVRLRRDSEGNYGYMYTTDQDKIGEAEDALAKANNDLYNIALNATNDYTQKQLKLEQDFKDKVAELSEKAAKDEIYRNTQYYDDLAQLQLEFENLSKSYTNEYNTAVYWLNETAATDQYEAWTQTYDGLMEKAQNWSSFTAQYVKDSVEAMQDYVKNLEPLMSGPNSIQISEEGIENLGKKTNDLTQAIIGENGLVHALGVEFGDVLGTVNTYLDTHQKYLSGVINAYETLAQKIAKVLKLQAIESGEEYSTDDLAVINAATNATSSFDPKEDIFSGATGGYTGSWGSYGKLAFLHEKELVLNKTDTENLLLSIDILRRLSTALDLQAMSNGLASISSTSTINTGGNSLAQDVTIHAEFPNAVDHNEIEMAFDSLINRASQYAGRF